MRGRLQRLWEGGRLAADGGGERMRMYECLYNKPEKSENGHFSISFGPPTLNCHS